MSSLPFVNEQFSDKADTKSAALDNFQQEVNPPLYRYAHQNAAYEIARGRIVRGTHRNSAVQALCYLPRFEHDNGLVAPLNVIYGGAS